MEQKYITKRVVRACYKCSNCCIQRTVYYTSGFSYGEHIVSNWQGDICAYVYLPDDHYIIDELETLLNATLKDNNIILSKSKKRDLISLAYNITCDCVNGRTFYTIPTMDCLICKHGRMIYDQTLGERQVEITMPYVTHEIWQRLNDAEKKEQIQSFAKEHMARTERR